MGDAEADDQVCRVGVFFDWQNCYRTARDAFGFQGSGIPGNVKPLQLAKMLAAAREEGQPRGVLTKARIYTGRASQGRDARTYAANRRQFAAWENADPALVEVFARTLDYSLGTAREKGVDVQLAVDLVRTSCFENEHNVAVVVSADTDLLPALELIVDRLGVPSIEVAAWSGPNWSPSPLALAGVTIRTHKMDRALYDRVADVTNYNVATTRPAQNLPFGRRPRPRK